MSDQNSLVRKNLENSLAIGGLSDLVKATEVVMLLLDTSGSMDGAPIEALRKVVADIKAQGHVPMIAFGGPYDAQVRFVDNVPNADGGTPLHLAIPFAKDYGATRLVVISDGSPDLPDQCMIEAKNFGGQIDVVFIGHAGDMGSVFLEAMAKATGGRRINGGDITINTKAITGTVIGLLEGDVAPTRAPIQGPGFVAAETDEDAAADAAEDADDDEDEDDEDDDEEDEDDSDDE